MKKNSRFGFLKNKIYSIPEDHLNVFINEYVI